MTQLSLATTYELFFDSKADAVDTLTGQLEEAVFHSAMAEAFETLSKATAFFAMDIGGNPCIIVENDFGAFRLSLMRMDREVHGNQADTRKISEYLTFIAKKLEPSDDAED